MRTITKIINGKEVSVDISDKKVDNFTDNTYFNIHFYDKPSSSEFVILHIGFGHLYLLASPEAKDINFDKTIEDEIENLIEEKGDGILSNTEYFIFTDIHGKQYDRKFAPFA